MRDVIPPAIGPRSTTMIFCPAFTSSCATDRPAIPAPTTTVSQLCLPLRRGASGATVVRIQSDLVRSPLTFISAAPRRAVVQLAAFRLTFRSAMDVSFLSAALSSLSVVVRSAAAASLPSCFANAIRLPYRVIS